MKASRLAWVGFALAAALAWSPVALGAPPNDMFDAPVELVGLEGSSGYSNVDATQEPDEPDHAGEPGGASVWFRWTAPRDGAFLIDTCDGASFDTVIAVYTGTVLSDLEVEAENDDACSLQSGVEIEVVEDVEYRIAVDGVDGATGSFVLWFGMRPAHDDFAAAQPIAGTTGSAGGGTHLATHELGEPHHAGALGVGSVWFRWTAPSTGRARFHTCSPPPTSDTLLAVYTGAAVAALTLVAENDDSDLCGAAGLVEFDAVGGTTYSIAVDGYETSTAFTLAWSLGPLVPRNITRPTIVGAAVENTFVTATPGEWVHAASFLYLWHHCGAGPLQVDSCALIRVPYSARLKVPAEAVGRRLRVMVTAGNSAGAIGVFSDETAAVVPGPPVNELLPYVQGVPRVGARVRAYEGTWAASSAPRLGVTYVWQRCATRARACANVEAASPDPYYRVKASDRGSMIRVVVTVSSTAGSTSAASLPTVLVRTPLICSVPRVVGKSVSAARKILGRSPCRFRVGVVRRARSARVRGLIVSQTPRPRARLAAGGRVRVVVSLGRRR